MWRQRRRLLCRWLLPPTLVPIQGPKSFFFFMVFYSPFLIFWLGFNLDCSIQESAKYFPAKVHGKCHKSATRPGWPMEMNESSSLLAACLKGRTNFGGRTFGLTFLLDVKAAFVFSRTYDPYSDFTSRIKMDLIHIFPGGPVISILIFPETSHFPRRIKIENSLKILPVNFVPLTTTKVLFSYKTPLLI